MRKYNSESYLRKNIITNPIFHFSVELKFAKYYYQSHFSFFGGVEVCQAR